MPGVAAAADDARRGAHRVDRGADAGRPRRHARGGPLKSVTTLSHFTFLVLFNDSSSDNVT